MVGEERGKSGIRKKLDDIHFNLIEKPLKKKKNPLLRKIKIPSVKRKAGFASVLLLRNNNTADLQKLPIIDGVVQLKKNGTYHSVPANAVFMLGKIPIVIQPEDGMKALTPQLLSEERDRDKDASTKSQKILIDILEKSQAKLKRGMGMGAKPLLMLVGGGIAIYILYSMVTAA